MEHIAIVVPMILVPLTLFAVYGGHGPQLVRTPARNKEAAHEVHIPATASTSDLGYR